MTKAEKLEALIKQAMDSGWKPSRYLSVKLNILPGSPQLFQAEYAEQAELIPAVIFNQDFVRALFGVGWHFNVGEEQKALQECHACHSPHTRWAKEEPHPYHDWWVHCFQWHLQQAVISDDSIGYMYEAVFGE